MRVTCVRGLVTSADNTRAWGVFCCSLGRERREEGHQRHQMQFLGLLAIS